MMKRARPSAIQATYGKAPPLNMATVATRAPKENPPADPPTRIFGLQDAPCYYPTMEEFMEPLRYIESIRPEAEKAGICKIIPPEGWKPTFAMDTEVFRFKTRIQKLNSMEGNTRTNLNYLDQLYKFHQQQGKPVTKVPTLDKRPIDLYRLKKEVAARGGYLKVTSGKKWAEIGRGMDYTRKECTSLSSALKAAYVKVVLPFEIYLSKQAKPAPEMPTPTQKREHSTDQPVKEQASTPPPPSSKPSVNIFSTETRKSKRIKKDPVSYADSEPSSPSESERQVSEPAKDDEEEDSDVCEICHKDNELEKMLICDGCELGYHTFCLTPPLQAIPKTDWYCAKCLVAGDDFGFEEGEEYSLSSFQQKCNSFKKRWFEKAGFRDGVVPEDVCEREFWKLVEDAYETVEVEYGADLHSTQHGSGFPSLERHPNDKYSSQPANLNNIPVLPESLFCHIKSDISGMMVPWLYVGMCFSTFCWHNEDHYTYSINYMHWGETKTWYGVPASDALKFEETMKLAVPELFEQQPDLLFQLVTMLSPGKLVANGVKVLALDQRPGQFVVTFPQAYHAGFNHGFNFAEAVNFAPPDWCQFGLECVQRYKEHKKHPVFSHDELILTTALNDTSIATAHWLQDEMKNLLDRELALREGLRKRYKGIKVILDEVDRPEEEVQCRYCNAYVYLSQVGCRCTTKVACHDHVSELCKCNPLEHFFRLRYSDEQLKEISDRVTETAAIPDAWIEKYRKTMLETRTPSLKLLRSLLAEADRIPFPIREASHLRKFVIEANEWVETASKSMVRKHHHQGRRLLERTLSTNNSTSGKRLEELQAMLMRVERMRFDCPEIKQLEESVEVIMEYQTEARKALERPRHDLSECRELYEVGVSMNISIDEIDRLETIVKDLTWIEKASVQLEELEDFNVICGLVADAERGGVSSTNPILVDLVKKQKAGQSWEDMALRALQRSPVDMEELRALIDTGKQLPVPKAILSKAEQLCTKTMDWDRSAENLLKKAEDPVFSQRPLITELKRAVKVSESVPIKPELKAVLEAENRKYDEWLALSQQLLVPEDTHEHSLEEILDDLKDNVDACAAVEKLPTVPAGPSNGTMHRAETEMEVDLTTDKKPAEGSTTVDLTDADEDPIYCLCRLTESGMMVECDECHEWYHGPCVRVTKRDVSAKSSYVCPVCNLSLVIRRDLPRPTLTELKGAYELGMSLGFFVPEVPLMGTIIDMVTEFQSRVNAFLKEGPFSLKDILAVKAYLRKIEGLDVDLPEERMALRAHILELQPSSMPAPVVMLSDCPTAPPLDSIELDCLCGQRGSKSEVLIQCGLCDDWYHTRCMGITPDKAQKLSKFVCPVCAVHRKKPYVHGPMHFQDEAQSRAINRPDKSKKRKSSKESILADSEPRVKRAYKKRQVSETGEKLKPTRRKSSTTQPVSPPESNGTNDSTPSTPSMRSSVPGGPMLPSFREAFMLPQERHGHPNHPLQPPYPSHQHPSRPAQPRPPQQQHQGPSRGAPGQAPSHPGSQHPGPPSYGRPGPPPQRPPYQGPPRSGPPQQGQPYHESQRQGLPPHGSQPRSGGPPPPDQRPYPGHSRPGPPFQGPPQQRPPSQGPPSQGPPSHGPTYQGPPHPQGPRSTPSPHGQPRPGSSQSGPPHPESSHTRQPSHGQARVTSSHPGQQPQGRHPAPSHSGAPPHGHVRSSSSSSQPGAPVYGQARLNGPPPHNGHHSAGQSQSSRAPPPYPSHHGPPPHGEQGGPGPYRSSAPSTHSHGPPSQSPRYTLPGSSPRSPYGSSPPTPGQSNGHYAPGPRPPQPRPSSHPQHHQHPQHGHDPRSHPHPSHSEFPARSQSSHPPPSTSANRTNAPFAPVHGHYPPPPMPRNDRKVGVVDLRPDTGTMPPPAPSSTSYHHAPIIRLSSITSPRMRTVGGGFPSSNQNGSSPSLSSSTSSLTSSPSQPVQPPTLLKTEGSHGHGGANGDAERRNGEVS
ncbi:[histone H3]-trimethyl-L-lysine4 demethylase [Entomortierella parvispora]|uniref:[histone H3]-trimethyl-L-lysine(4) demethylase n=1 Tax=Entomortierella parvispora TaxID=205924 RepID=A0A9P3H3P8_9FUNG|nr:[histone H3]-trimethyl-L-lysine4 demethylase [Entomortierella parvispora]